MLIKPNPERLGSPLSQNTSFPFLLVLSSLQKNLKEPVHKNKAFEAENLCIQQKSQYIGVVKI